MVFGGWLEGSQKDILLGQVLGSAQDRQKSDLQCQKRSNSPLVLKVLHLLLHALLRQ